MCHDKPPVDLALCHPTEVLWCCGTVCLPGVQSQCIRQHQVSMKCSFQVMLNYRMDIPSLEIPHVDVCGAFRTIEIMGKIVFCESSVWK